MSETPNELLMHYLLELKQELQNYLDPLGMAEVERAFVLGEHAHRGQNRKSGEPYITHPVAVAKILAELRLDTETLTKVLRMGAKVKKLLGRDTAAETGEPRAGREITAADLLGP